MINSTTRLKLLIALLAAGVLLAGCGDYLLTTLLDGETGEPLTLTPVSTVVATSGSVAFIATGGYPPYVFALESGPGSVDSAAGIYSAPTYDSAATVSVTDLVGARQTASVTVTVPTTQSIDYAVGSVNWASGLTAGQAVTGTFTISNVGLDNGTHAVTWQIYASLDPPDNPQNYTLVDTGTTPALDSGASSGPIPFSGYWPPAADTYYLVAMIFTSPDDPLTANNRLADGGRAVNAPPALNVDYFPTISAPIANPVGSGEIVSESFQIHNAGPDNGGSQVFWQAYLSLDGTVSADDDLIDAGSVDPPDSGMASGLIPVNSGQWPVVGGDTTYNLIVTVQASDEPGGSTGNNTDTETTTVTRADVDYAVDSLTNSSPVSTFSPITDTLRIRNYGTDNGVQTVVWEVRMSDDPVFDLTDDYVDSGSFAALISGGDSGNIPIAGFWPGSSGQYFLVVSISASDDVNPTDNFGTGGPVNVNAPDVDYTVESVTTNYLTVAAGSSVSESFVYRNSGNTSGTVVVSYTATVSGDAIYGNGDDTSIATVGLGAGSWLGAQTASTDIPIDGYWPGTGGAYYLIVEVNSGDDTDPANNHHISGPYQVVDPPDYEIAFGSFPVQQFGGNPGESVVTASTDHGGPPFHEILIQELNNSDGLQDISWKIYQSNNPALDAGDILMDSGQISPLSASDLVAIQVDFPLPGSSGEWFYIATITAGDDGESGNNSATIGPVRVWESGPGVNIENDPNPDDDYFAVQAKDFSLILNDGDVAFITGFKDPAGFYDLYVFRTGPFTTTVQIRATWAAPQDTFDLLLREEADPPPAGAFVDLSLDVAPGEEPGAGGYWLPNGIGGLNPNTLYYLTVDTLTVPGEGDPYDIEIKGGP